jgi:hypothetical protein
MADTPTPTSGPANRTDRTDDNLVEQAQEALSDLVDDVQNAFGLGEDPADTIDQAAAELGVTDTDGTWGVEVGENGLDVGGDGSVTITGEDGKDYEIPVQGAYHVDPIDVGGGILPGQGSLSGQAGPDGGQLDGTYDSGTGYAGDLHADEDGLDVTGTTPGGMGTIHADEDGAQGGWVGDDGSTAGASVDEGGLDASYDPDGDGSGTLHVDEDGAEGTWKNDDGTFSGRVNEDGGSATWEGEDNTTTVELDGDGLDAHTEGTWGDPLQPDEGYGTYDGDLHVDEDGLTAHGTADGHWEGEVEGVPVGADGSVEGDLSVGRGEVDGTLSGEGRVTVGGVEMGTAEGELSGHFGEGAADLHGEGEVAVTGNYGGVPITGSVDGSGDAHVDGDGFDVDGNVGLGLDTPIFGGQDAHGSIGISAEGDWGDAGDAIGDAADDAGDAGQDVLDQGGDAAEDAGDAVGDALGW